MRKSHVAYFGFPLPACVNPTTAIVSVLARRGYRVSYVTSDRFAPKMAALGALVVPSPEYRVVEPVGESWVRFATDTLAQVTEFYEHNRPDLVIYDLPALAGRILAAKWNVPAVQISPQFAVDRENFERQIPDVEFRRSFYEQGQVLDAFLQQHGFAAEDFVFRREQLNIYVFPKALQPEGGVTGDDSFHASRCAGEQPYSVCYRLHDTDGRPVVLVSTSTSYGQGAAFFRTCLEALSALQVHVILSIGPETDAASLMPLPPHCEIVQGIPQVMLLADVTLFIYPGGIASMSEAMYHGVSLLALTHGIPELEWLGDHITSLGLGFHLRKADMSVDSIRSAARRILDDEVIHENVKRMQRAVRRGPGAEETVNRIEEFLGTI